MTVGRVGPTYKCLIGRFWCFQGFEPLMGAEYRRAGRILGSVCLSASAAGNARAVCAPAQEALEWRCSA